MRSTRFWILLIAALLALSLAGVLLSMRGAGGRAAVYQDGELLRTIDLTSAAPYAFTVEGPAGTNTVEVERGRVRVSRADCPDQVCVHQGWISTGAAPIVCLPNKLVIQVEGGGSVDGVSG